VRRGRSTATILPAQRFRQGGALARQFGACARRSERKETIAASGIYDLRGMLASARIPGSRDQSGSQLQWLHAVYFFTRDGKLISEYKT
jgi:hypothetical protein